MVEIVGTPLLGPSANILKKYLFILGNGIVYFKQLMCAVTVRNNLYGFY